MHINSFSLKCYHLFPYLINYIFHILLFLPLSNHISVSIIYIISSIFYCFYPYLSIFLIFHVSISYIISSTFYCFYPYLSIFTIFHISVSFLYIISSIFYCFYPYRSIFIIFHISVYISYIFMFITSSLCDNLLLSLFQFLSQLISHICNSQSKHF